MNQKIKTIIKSSLIVMLFAFSLNALGAWVSPPSGCVPPNCSVDPSLNVGGTLQSKAGILVFNGGQSLGSFEVGPTYGAGLFKVNGSGNITKINNLAYTSWPATHVVGYLKNNGSGVLTWEAGGGGLSGSGTTNYLSKWTNSTTLGDSVIIDNGTNVGIGDATPASLFTVGNGDDFQINTTGAITSASGITSSGTITFSGLSGSGDRCVHVNASGVMTATASDCGTGSGGITSLNGLTGATQVFATGTSGTNFNIDSTGTTHTFNLPIASSTNTGKLSSGDWTTFSSKVDPTRTISTTAPLSGGGDLSANRTITTSMSTNKLIGRSTAGTGVMEEITVGSGLTLSGGTLTATGGVTPASLTRTNDTNVTVTLGGTPATALLQATSLTMGWTGQLSISRGGTGKSSISAKSIWVADDANVLIEKTMTSPRQSVRTDASNINWEIFTPADINTAQTISGVKTFSATPLLTSGATGTGTTMVLNASNQLVKLSSSKRYKKNIIDLDIDTTKIYDLHPVSFNYISDNTKTFGLIAEEVALTIPDLVNYAIEKDVVKGSTSLKLIPESVNYSNLSVLLLKETKKHEETIKEQGKAIEELKAEIKLLKENR